MTERDTHFQGSARVLYDELSALYLSKGLEAMLGDPDGEITRQEITLIAQFAYDLFCEHRDLLREASILLDDAYQQIMYGGDAASSLDLGRVQQWQQRATKALEQ